MRRRSSAKKLTGCPKKIKVNIDYNLLGLPGDPENDKLREKLISKGEEANVMMLELR